MQKIKDINNLSYIILHDPKCNHHREHAQHTSPSRMTQAVSPNTVVEDNRASTFFF
jgi:hypothetical protein